MNSFISTLGMLISLAASLLILKCFGFKGAPVVAAIAIVTLSTSVLERMPELISLFGELNAVGTEEYVSSAVKVVGVGYLGGISQDVCRELGEGGVARCISIVSRLEMITIATPHIREAFFLITDLIGSG